MRLLSLFFLIALFFIFAACESETSEMEEAAEDMKRAAEEMAQAGKEMGESFGDMSEDIAEDMAKAMKKMTKAFGDEVDVEPLDFRDLKDLLPKKLAGLKRTDFSGERKSMFGIKISSAQAEYEGRKGESMEVTITDLGTIKGVGKFAKFGWSMIEIDKETNTGYERTIEYRGHKGFEEYDKEEKEGKIDIIIANRFAVEINGYNIPEKKLRDGLDDIDVDKLEDWKDRGITL
jgi:hypothetical protein